MGKSPSGLGEAIQTPEKLAALPLLRYSQAQNAHV
jgi:hypothetical protein